MQLEKGSSHLIGVYCDADDTKKAIRSEHAAMLDDFLKPLELKDHSLSHFSRSDARSNATCKQWQWLVACSSEGSIKINKTVPSEPSMIALSLHFC